MKGKLLFKGLVVVICLLLLSASRVMAQDFCKGDFDYDGDVDADDIGEFLDHFGRFEFNNPCPPDGPAPVAKTGQTWSFMPTDDGDLQNGVAWPNPRFTIIYYDANLQLCNPQTADCDDDPATDLVQDNLTGLMWTRNANTFTNPATWDGAFFGLGFVNPSWGYDDWRLPNVRELESLLNYDGSAGFTVFLPDPMPFVNVPCTLGGDEFWTSTQWATIGVLAAYTVDFCLGGINYRDQTETHYVWIVRGGR
jgi:hypothetical protein